MRVRQLFLRHWIPLAVLAVGLSFTGVLGWWGRANERERIDVLMDQQSGVVAETLTGAVEAILKDAAATAGLFEASEEVTEEEWRQFARRIGHEPGSLGLAYFVVVPAGDLEDHLAEARAHRPEYAVVRFDGSLVEAEEGEIFYPLRYFVPSSPGTPTLLGFDAGSDPLWAEAIRDAAEVRRPVISRLGLLPPTHAAEGFVAVAPIIDEGEVLGFTAVVALLDRVVESGLAGSLGEVVVWDVSDMFPIARPVDDPFRRIAEIPVGGRTWWVEVAATDTARADLASPWRGAVLLGLLLTVVAAIAAHLGAQVVRAGRETAELQRLTAEKDEFLAAVSHELRTPLTAVVGMAEILAESLGSGDAGEELQHREYLEMLRSEAWELARVVEDVLLLGRLETGTLALEPGPVEVRWEASSVVAEVEPPDRVSIEIEGHARAWADRLRLRQILRNLLGNALGHGGQNITIEIFETSAQVKVRVTDDGPGVPDDQVSGLFTASRGVKRTPGGPRSLGLGLRISHRLALASGGGLEYYRVDGHTVFELRLPRPRATVPQEPPRLSQEAPSSEKARRSDR